MDMLDLLGLSKDSRLVVLNRSDARVGLTGADVERVLKKPTNAHIPSSRDVPISINRGVPIVLDKPSHPVSKAIRELALGQITNRTQHRGGALRRRGDRAAGR
jgi:pilus assembly protein CpaE